jgi:hypothetical protein
MKYLIGAGIGGVFGFSLPMYINAQELNDYKIDLRQEDSQPVEVEAAPPIDMSLTLPDNMCNYLKFKSEDAKEQAKECLNETFPAIPAI